MNLERQGKLKIGVPQTVRRLHAFFDALGEFCFNNVRVGGIQVDSEDTGWFLLGILNSPVPDWVFRRIARAKEGGYFEANKQFIAPLPIPEASPEDRAEVGRRARELQELHTRRRDGVAKVEARLRGSQTAPMTPAPGPDWLWSEAGTVETWKRSAEATEGMSARERTAWAKERHAAALQERHDALDALLQPGVGFEVEAGEDELVLRIGGREALRLHDRPDTPFIAAQWRQALRDQNVTEAFDARRLQRLLLDLRVTTDAPLRDRIVALDGEILALDREIAAREAELNALVYRLYALAPDEIAMVEAG